MAFQSAKDLKIDGNLIALLPADFESVQALDEMKERYGGTGFVSIVIRSSDEAKLLEFAENAKVELEALPDIDYATYNRPSEFFRRHALYFIETADLEDLTEQLETRVEWERRNANPLYLDFEEEEAPPPLSLDHLKEKYLKKAGVGQAPQAKITVPARPRPSDPRLTRAASQVSPPTCTLPAQWWPRCRAHSMVCSPRPTIQTYGSISPVPSPSASTDKPWSSKTSSSRRLWHCS